MNRYKSFMTVILLSFLIFCVMSCKHVSEHQNDTDDERATGADSEPDTDTIRESSIDSDTDVVPLDDVPLPVGCKTDPCECGEGTGVVCVDFSTQIIARGTDKPVPNVEVTALCNETGDPLPVVDSVISDGDGKLTLKNVPKGHIGLLFQKSTDYDNAGLRSEEWVTTWHWGVDTTVGDRTMYIMWKEVYELIQSVIGCPEEDDSGNSLYFLSGAAYWMHRYDGYPKPVGCGTITLEPETAQAEFWYFPENGAPYSHVTNPNNGAYLVCGLLANKEYTVKFLVDDQELVQDCFPMRIIEGEKNVHMLYLTARTAEKPGC